MKSKLYMPYYDYNDGAFDVNGNYYNEDDYINAVSTEYNKNKDIIYNSVLDAKNGTGSLIQGNDGQTYKFGANIAQNEDKVAYSECDAMLYDGNGEDETVDNIITHFAKKEPFIEMLEFDDENCEEEFMCEVSLWIREHNGINKYKDFKGEEWAWVNEPKRNIRISFDNNANEKVYATLENCKIMDIVGSNAMIIFIERIRLIDKF